MQKYLIVGLIIALSVCTAPVAAWDIYDPFTQGYWKNHPEDWPAPWNNINYGQLPPVKTGGLQRGPLWGTGLQCNRCEG